jgi:hypothetical protein
MSNTHVNFIPKWYFVKFGDSCIFLTKYHNLLKDFLGDMEPNFVSCLGVLQCACKSERMALRNEFALSDGQSKCAYPTPF